MYDLVQHTAHKWEHAPLWNEECQAYSCMQCDTKVRWLHCDIIFALELLMPHISTGKPTVSATSRWEWLMHLKVSRSTTCKPHSTMSILATVAWSQIQSRKCCITYLMQGLNSLQRPDSTKNVIEQRKQSIKTLMKRELDFGVGWGQMSTCCTRCMTCDIWCKTMTKLYTNFVLGQCRPAEMSSDS